MTPHDLRKKLSRREFIKWGAAAGATVAAGAAGAQQPRPAKRRRKPNILLIITDQQGLDTLSAHGCEHVHTPHLDRLAASGASFMESHCTNPLCSPSRSSLFTGRMPSETGVTRNSLRIRKGLPSLGQWLKARGYDTIFTGKWHLPREYTSRVPGFTVLPGGVNSQGAVGDTAVAAAAESFLAARRSTAPFFMVASFLQPHDICEWVMMHRGQRKDLPFPQLAGQLPALPPNFDHDPREPKGVQAVRNYHRVDWTDEQWRYYLWSYHRMVEEVDSEIGRVLEAVEGFGHARNTLVLFTADHGEGRARHHMVGKNFLYDEAVKVPLIASWPGHVAAGVQDGTHLVSGLDMAATVCDYAGAKPHRGARGRSLRPLLEGKPVGWHEFVVAEAKLNTGRMLRTEAYKYVRYTDDEVEQLFDMRNDPGETQNLAGQASHAATLKGHQDLLRTWEAGLTPA